jgi:hypothetical protein
MFLCIIQQRPIYFEEQITKVFEFLKDLNINEKIKFSKFFNLLHLDEETYILNLRSKLIKHFLKMNTIKY